MDNPFILLNNILQGSRSHQLHRPPRSWSFLRDAVPAATRGPSFYIIEQTN